MMGKKLAVLMAVCMCLQLAGCGQSGSGESVSPEGQTTQVEVTQDETNQMETAQVAVTTQEEATTEAETTTEIETEASAITEAYQASVTISGSVCTLVSDLVVDDGGYYYGVGARVLDSDGKEIGEVATDGTTYTLRIRDELLRVPYAHGLEIYGIDETSGQLVVVESLAETFAEGTGDATYTYVDESGAESTITSEEYMERYDALMEEALYIEFTAREDAGTTAEVTKDAGAEASVNAQIEECDDASMEEATLVEANTTPEGVVCSNCGGSGVCPECGNGTLPCVKCDGTLIETCGICKGAGSYTCNLCHGAGYEGPCRLCMGTGVISTACTTCMGSGLVNNVACTLCLGTGILSTPCATCLGTGIDHENVCKFCNGVGIETCYHCGGKGGYDCTLCEGSGLLGDKCKDCQGAFHCMVCGGSGYVTE